MQYPNQNFDQRQEDQNYESPASWNTYPTGPYQQQQPEYTPQPTYGYPITPSPAPHPSSGLVLALGIIGLLVPFVSFGAWWMGVKVSAEERSGAYLKSDSTGVGKWLGIIVSALTLIMILIMVLGFALMVAAG